MIQSTRQGLYSFPKHVQSLIITTQH